MGEIDRFGRLEQPFEQAGVGLGLLDVLEPTVGGGSWVYYREWGS